MHTPHRSNSIRLHPEHGLNPTMPVCWFCGEDKGEIALLGSAYKGQAPMHMCIDRSPCSKCQAMMKTHVLFMEATSPEHRTGRMVWVKEEAVSRVIRPSNMAQDVLKHRVCFIDTEAWKAMGFTETSDGG